MKAGSHSVVSDSSKQIGTSKSDGGALTALLQRVVGNAEEIAFNDPPSGKAEQLVLNYHLERLVKHTHLSALQRFVQQVFDGFAVKYMASAVALLLYAAPLYFRDPSMRGSQDEITQVGNRQSTHTIPS